MKIFSVSIFIAILMFSTTAQAQSYITETGRVSFTSSVPLHSFTGRSEHLNGLIDLEENLVDFYIDLQTLDTGNGKRDRDMYSTLEVEEHPFAEFTGSLTSSYDPESAEEQNVTVTGDFSIHGVTQNIEVEGTLQKTGAGLQLNASWILNMADYKIEPPGILFYRVDEEIEVRIEAELEQQDDETNET
ncbi:MAG: YceI family protein [Balneolaceae bacterium]|nr:YceI family protein [Balneolaceae bacterium]MDR9407336.1 YceI family protein [Balneolaceae bacterium]